MGLDKIVDPFAVVSSGIFVPPYSVSTEKVERLFGANGSKPDFVSVTGVESRHISPNEGSAIDAKLDYLVNAARDAISGAESEPQMLIFANDMPRHVPDHRTVPTEGELREKMREIGLGNIEIRIVDRACSGAVYALQEAHKLPSSYASVLIGAATSMTRYIMWTETTAPLFGEGAGVFLLERNKGHGFTRILTGESQYENGSFVWGGKIRDIPEEISRVSPAHLHTEERIGPFDLSIYKNPDEYVMWLNGRKIFVNAVEYMRHDIDAALIDAEIGMAGIDTVVAHQANLRILRSVAKKYPGHEEKFLVDITKLGNTSAASVILAWHNHQEAIGKARERQGRVLFVGFGVTPYDMTHGAALYDFSPR